jgi:hypothetical protein
MDFRINSLLVSMIVLVSVLLSGCVTYQIAKYVEGDEVNVPKEELEVGKTTLEEALSILGAPDKVAKVGVENLLVYEEGFALQKQDKSGNSLERNHQRKPQYGCLWDPRPL